LGFFADSKKKKTLLYFATVKKAGIAVSFGPALSCLPGK